MQDENLFVLMQKFMSLYVQKEYGNDYDEHFWF